MSGNQVVSSMFDANTSIHMVRIISIGDWDEDPKWLGFVILVSYPQVVFGDQLESWHGSTLYAWWSCSVFEIL